MESEKNGQNSVNENDLKKGQPSEEANPQEQNQELEESKPSETSAPKAEKEEGPTDKETSDQAPKESPSDSEKSNPKQPPEQKGEKNSNGDEHHEEYDFKEEEEHEEHEEDLNFEDLNKEELLDKIKEYSGKPIEKIKDKVINELHDFFYKIVESDEKEAKEKFIKEGGEEGDFEFRGDNEIISHFEDYYKSFKEKRRHFLSDLDKRKEANVAKKEELLESLRKMVDGDVDKYSIKTLREIETEWREAEPVLPARARELWANFNALRDRFYDQRSLLYEMKDLDRKKNQTLKEEIIEKAEHLLSKESMVNAVAELKKLHEEYKHIGPVPKEIRSQLWEKFKDISDKIHDRRREVSEEFKKVLDENQNKKEELIKKIREVQDFASDRINEWNEKTKEVLNLQEEWKKVGPTPKTKAKEISREFWNNFKQFFKHKQNFFKEIDKQRNQNLETKLLLCDEVERIKDDEDWEATATRIKEIQKEWKEIGPVPRKKSEQIYQRFKGLCDEFFNRRRGLLEEKNEEFKENLKKKNEICKEIEKLGEVTEDNLSEIQSLVKDWNSAGFVERHEIKNARNTLRESLNKLLEKKDKKDPEFENFSFRIEALVDNAGGGGGARNLEHKIEKIRKQIGQIQREAENWKQNVEMFAKTDSGNKIREEVEERIKAAEGKVRALKEKIKILRN